MTSSEWRKRDDLLSSAAGILANPHMTVMVDILKSESPINVPLPMIGSSDSDKTMAYGMELGYQHCLKKLKAFALPIKEQEQVHSTFKQPQ